MLTCSWTSEMARTLLSLTMKHFRETRWIYRTAGNSQWLLVLFVRTKHEVAKISLMYL